ncbi:MAG: helix-hairpin-helix domain-containing protein [Desulfobacterales bacterium]|nr:helix-hairpin-helix domain-containing protein [Desulfobacterales bacterium]
MKTRFSIGFIATVILITFVSMAWAQSAEKININKATLKELQQIKGIGKTMAERIVQYREEQGPFKSPEEIMKVKGIGAKKYDTIKDKILID